MLAKKIKYFIVIKIIDLYLFYLNFLPYAFAERQPAITTFVKVVRTNANIRFVFSLNGTNNSPQESSAGQRLYAMWQLRLCPVSCCETGA
jgi:hypothetical protein